MKPAHGAIALLIIVAWASEAPAQGLVISSLGYGFVKPSRSYVVSSYVGRPVGGQSRVIGYYFGRPTARVRVYYFAPAALDVPSVMSGATDNTLPASELPIPDDKLLIRPRPKPRPEEVAMPQPAEEKPEPSLPGTPASGFRPVRPEDRVTTVPPAPPVAVTPKPRSELRLPARPAEDDSPLALGKQAFAAGEYARAERRFQQVTTATPDEPAAYFLLAQAQFALGKYKEAVANIHAGLQRQPGWPQSRFRPRDLYAPELVDFPEHLKRLAEALVRYPDDPVLLFLTAYQLWFDGRQDEARLWFQKAAAVMTDKSGIDRFAKP
jgi:hypothetical protein